MGLSRKSAVGARQEFSLTYVQTRVLLWLVATIPVTPALWSSLVASNSSTGPLLEVSSWLPPLVLCALWMLSALLLVWWPTVSGFIALTTLVAAITPGAETLWDSPTKTLAAIIAVLLVWLVLRQVKGPGIWEQIKGNGDWRDHLRDAVPMLLGTAWGLWLWAVVGGSEFHLILYACGWAIVVATAVLTVSIEPPTLWWRSKQLRAVIAGVIAVSVIGLSRQIPEASLSYLGVVLPLFSLQRTFRQSRSDDDDSSDWFTLVSTQPAQLMGLTFMGLCAIFFFAFRLPFMTLSETPMPWTDALFTAVTTVCLTGLTVVDTYSELSIWGHLTLLVALHCGALGILTFSAALFYLVGRDVSVRVEGTIASMAGTNDRSKIGSSFRHVVLYLVAVEGIATVGFTILLWEQGTPWLVALYDAFYMAASSFCNAGFTPTPGSMELFAQTPSVLFLSSVTTIFGGLSPFVVARFPRWFRRERVPLQDRLVVHMTWMLLIGGAVAYLLIEWSLTLHGLGWWEKFANAWFQASTMRSAGFNSVELSQAHPATHLLLASLMFIGGSPGGVAGGVKVTTAAIMILSVASTLQGRARITLGMRQIAHRSVYQAAATIFVFGALVMGFTMLLILTQSMSTRVAAFEVISALGTVGASIGGTPLLDDVGKLLIVTCMFIGRLGPLTLFFIISRRYAEAHVGMVKEEIEVG